MTTSKKVASKAGRQLKSKSTTKSGKAVAMSDLSQSSAKKKKTKKK